MDRQKIATQRQLVALYRRAHQELVSSLRIRSYEATNAEQQSYGLARVFWVREFPAAQKLFTDELEMDTQLQHSLYVLKKSFESTSVGGAIDDLKRYAHVKDLDEAATSGADLFERYDAHLNRQEATLPTQRQVAVGRIQRLGGWLASRPDWIETHKTSALLMTFWALLLLTAVGILTPVILGAIADVIRAVQGR